MADIQRWQQPDGETIAYRARRGKTPGVLWLSGFKSDMNGTKAQALDSWAAQSGYAYLRFDYFGHGQSSGDFRAGTVTRWRDDALCMLDNLTEGPQIIVGSSMGAWIALLLARLRPERLAGLLLIAPAADFTETLLWARLPPDTRRQIESTGEWLRPSAYDPEPYPITRRLIEDGRKHLLLQERFVLPVPVHVFQGMQDRDVPWQHALTVGEAVQGNVTFTLVKDGDHRLSRRSDIRQMLRLLNGLIGEAQSLSLAHARA